mmetsp:Transcript_21624/g.33449  ORF Transcript_21624/g.33449 Transcript_21624/m.33449 type:complete len:345 (-) Transcript_21624:597-1631(-)
MMEESTEDTKVLQASPQLQFGAVEEHENENENNKQKEVEQFAHETIDSGRDTEEESEEELYVTAVQKEHPADEYKHEHENKHGHLGSLQRPLDTTKESLADEYVRLSLQFECALIQHKLALEYFEFRSFYFVFFPLTIIATLITIIGFLISGTTQYDADPLLTGHKKQILSLVVGILGAISTLLNAVGKRANYQSQSDMHRSAVKALEKICLTVDNERDWFDRNHRNDVECSDNHYLGTKLGTDLKTHQASFKAILDACCDSPVPYQVVQTFNLLEQTVSQQVFGPDGRGRSSDLEDPLKFYYQKLWKEYSTYRLWPLVMPRMKVAAKCREWKEERDGNVGNTV